MKKAKSLHNVALHYSIIYVKVLLFIVLGLMYKIVLLFSMYQFFLLLVYQEEVLLTLMYLLQETHCVAYWPGVNQQSG